MSEVQLYWNSKLQIDQIRNTWETSFNRKFSKKLWMWRFVKNPNENKVYIGYIFEKDILASYYAVSPALLNLGEESVLKAGLMNMAMTHPKYQGRGYFKKIADCLHNEISKDGIQCLYVFPTRQVTLKIYREYFKWIELFPLYIMTCDCLHSNIKNRSLLNDLNYESAEVNATSIKTASKFQIWSGKIHPIRDYNNLEWRLLTHPTNKYFYLKVSKGNTTLAILFFKYFDKSVDVMEVFYNPNYIHERVHLFDGLINYFIINKIRVNIWAHPFSEQFQFLKNIGFVETDLITYFGILMFEENADLRIPSNWHISFIDSDVY